MNKIMNGGTTICGDHKSVVIKNGQVYIDGELVSDQRYNYSGPIIINGNVEEVDGVNITINGDVHGDVDGTTINIKGSVLGDVDGTTINIGNKKSENKSSDVTNDYIDIQSHLGYVVHDKFNDKYNIDYHDELKRNLEEMKNIILNDPTLNKDYYNKMDNTTEDCEITGYEGTPREENEISLKDLVKRKKRRK